MSDDVSPLLVCRCRLHQRRNYRFRQVADDPVYIFMKNL
jgi:hypothetical protein